MNARTLARLALVALAALAAPTLAQIEIIEPSREAGEWEVLDLGHDFHEWERPVMIDPEIARVYEEPVLDRALFGSTSSSSGLTDACSLRNRARITVYGVSGGSVGSTMLNGSKCAYETYAFYDLNGNGRIDDHHAVRTLSPSGSDRYAFPRVPGPNGGGWTLLEGRGYLGGANMIVVARYSSWNTAYVDQFVALHCKVDASGTITAIAMFAGDLVNHAALPGGAVQGVAMMSTQQINLWNVSGSLPRKPTPLPGGAIPTADYFSGRIKGTAEAFVSFTDSTGIVYANQIRIEFDTQFDRDYR